MQKEKAQESKVLVLFPFTFYVDVEYFSGKYD